MEYGKTSPRQVCLHPSHTHIHTHQRNPAGLLVHLPRHYNPTELPLHSQALSGIHPQSHWAPCAFTGIHSHTNSQSRCPNLNQPFSPIPGSMLLCYTSYKKQHGSSCVLARCGVQSSGILSTCGLPVSCRLATSVVQSRRGPHGLSSTRIFMFLGGMKAAFVPSPSLEPWRARRLDGADVDSRFWLASNRTYIARVVLFMV